MHTDPTGGSDTELPRNVRVYMIAGTQHGGRPGVDPGPGPCVNPRNPHSATPALRALFAALEEWVTKGTAPPPSQVPRVADGTAVMARELADRDGSFIAFARTKAEREAARDPRLSLEERYGTCEAYAAKIKTAAEGLVADRLLLPADAAAYVEAAKACDRF